jgi:hypothetical protein
MGVLLLTLSDDITDDSLNWIHLFLWCNGCNDENNIRFNLFNYVFINIFVVCIPIGMYKINISEIVD